MQALEFVEQLLPELFPEVVLRSGESLGRQATVTTNRPKADGGLDVTMRVNVPRNAQRRQEFHVSVTVDKVAFQPSSRTGNSDVMSVAQLVRERFLESGAQVSAITFSKRDDGEPVLSFEFWELPLAGEPSEEPKPQAAPKQSKSSKRKAKKAPTDAPRTQLAQLNTRTAPTSGSDDNTPPAGASA